MRQIHSCSTKFSACSTRFFLGEADVWMKPPSFNGRFKLPDVYQNLSPDKSFQTIEINPANQLIGRLSVIPELSHYLQAFILPRWLALGFLNHQQVRTRLFGCCIMAPSTPRQKSNQHLHFLPLSWKSKMGVSPIVVAFQI